MTKPLFLSIIMIFSAPTACDLPLRGRVTNGTFTEDQTINPGPPKADSVVTTCGNGLCDWIEMSNSSCPKDCVTPCETYTDCAHAPGASFDCQENQVRIYDVTCVSGLCTYSPGDIDLTTCPFGCNKETNLCDTAPGNPTWDECIISTEDPEYSCCGDFSVRETESQTSYEACTEACVDGYCWSAVGSKPCETAIDCFSSEWTFCSAEGRYIRQTTGCINHQCIYNDTTETVNCPFGCNREGCLPECSENLDCEKSQTASCEGTQLTTVTKTGMCIEGTCETLFDTSTCSYGCDIDQCKDPECLADADCAYLGIGFTCSKNNYLQSDPVCANGACGYTTTNTEPCEFGCDVQQGGCLTQAPPCSTDADCEAIFERIDWCEGDMAHTQAMQCYNGLCGKDKSRHLCTLGCTNGGCITQDLLMCTTDGACVISESWTCATTAASSEYLHGIWYCFGSDACKVNYDNAISCPNGCTSDGCIEVP